MTRRRRGPLALGALAVAALTVAGPGAADAQVRDHDPWSGTVIWGGTEGRAVHGSISWSQRGLERDPSTFTVDLIVDTEAGQPGGCEPPRFGSSGDAQNPHTSTVRAERSPTDGRTWEGSFEIPVVATCNGTYTVGAVIRNDSSPTPTQATTTIRVARPAEPPAQATASRAEDGTVALVWSAPADGLPPDFTGYRVLRTVGDVSKRIVDDTLDTDLVDHPDLQPGQTATYEVMTLRSGPDGTTIASAPATATVELPGPEQPDDTADGEPGGGAADAGSGTGGQPRVARPATGNRGPSVPALPRPTTPTTLDTGFGETLPFDLDRVEGPEDPVLPDDGFASLLYDEEAGAGLLVPGATAAVLAVWAMHLRYLNRLAKRP
jgi:hypothetical protein